MKGLILSGGSGTRLRPLTFTNAKQLVPVANKPVLFYGIEALVAAGITEIGIVTGDTGGEIRAATGDGARFGASVTFIPQSHPLGLAHAVKTGQAFLGDSSFVMYLGDNIVRDGIADHVAAFDHGDADATVLLARMKSVSRLGVAVIEQDRIVRLIEKPEDHVSDLAVVGVYLLRPMIFEAIDRIVPGARGELEMTDALQRMIDDGRRVTPRVITGWWKDTGRAEDMLEANRIMLDRLAERHEGTMEGAVRIEGTVVVESGAVLRNCVVRGPAIIGSGTLIEDAYVGPFTSIDAGCVIRHAEIEHCIILRDTTIEDIGTKIEDSLIGRSCVIRRSPVRPSAHKLVLGDRSSVELRH